MTVERIKLPPKEKQVPPRGWHAATCEHKWCNCYYPEGHAIDGDCRHCKRKKTNERLAAKADPTIRHPEGMA
jgi:hypothetical protein